MSPLLIFVGVIAYALITAALIRFVAAATRGRDSDDY